MINHKSKHKFDDVNKIASKSHNTKYEMKMIALLGLLFEADLGVINELNVKFICQCLHCMEKFKISHRTCI